MTHAESCGDVGGKTSLPVRGDRRSGMASRQARKIGRRNSDGEIVPLDVAKRHPSTHTIEMMPLPGYGDTGRSKKSKK